MKRFYQTEWQGIQFTGLTTLSETRLAGAEFYNAFYREFFRRYANYDDLDASWLLNKKEVADWIAAQLKTSARVLSVGCGLGYMESYLHRNHGAELELHVSDYASDALKWLRQVLPEDRIHLVDNPVDDELYDFIYLSAVDYAVPTNDMIDLLAQQRCRLAPSGTCLIISASYLNEGMPMSVRIKAVVKHAIKALLSSAGFYHRGQFWGWMRTRSEYRDLMLGAGYSQVEDGFIETPNQRTYFIRGSV
ncbi:MAG: methyltransferase domain-containing protein [Nitrosomonadales bacterium]|nr:methyltransferase domain-containing protein [Nitrosomonadales bacterium]